MGMRKAEQLVFMIFAGIGVLFLIVGAIICIHIFDDSDHVDTTGVITEISYSRDRDGDRDYNVYVAYEVDGVSYESRMNSYSSSFYEGKEIDIYYDRDNPRRIGAKELRGLFVIFPGIGLLFFCMGGIGLAVIAKKNRRSAALRETGYRVMAEYVETEVNIHYSVNNRNPYRVVCRWRDPESGKTHIFKSENLWENPEPMISARGVWSFSVYLDRKHSKRYVMDTDWLKLRSAELL